MKTKRTFKVNIACDYAATGEAWEIADLLRSVATALEAQDFDLHPRPIIDANGNTVGTYRYIHGGR